MEANERECPFCSEIILAEAKKCKHCREWIVKPQTTATVESTVPEPQKNPNPNMRVCRDCHKEVSLTAKKCPHCGADNPAINSGVYSVITLIAIGLGIWLWISMGKACDDVQKSTQKFSADMDRIQKDYDKSMKDLDRDMERLKHNR